VIAPDDLVQGADLREEKSERFTEVFALDRIVDALVKLMIALRGANLENMETAFDVFLHLTSPNSAMD
jgi:hypothetical protein